MPEVSLQGAGIMAFVRQRVSAGVAQHMRVYLKTNASVDPCSFHYAGEASRAEGRSPFRSEHEGRLGLLLALKSPQRP